MKNDADPGRCAECGCQIGRDNGPRDGWQLDDGRTVCQACSVAQVSGIIRYVRRCRMFAFATEIVTLVTFALVCYYVGIGWGVVFLLCQISAGLGAYAAAEIDAIRDRLTNRKK